MLPAEVTGATLAAADAAGQARTMIDLPAHPERWPAPGQAAAPARLPPGHRVYAIGDVHGCAARLARLHALVEQDRAARPVPHATLLHLGDYVDRGPDSAGVLAMLVRGEAAGADAVVNLRGNHEAMLLAALGAAPAADGAREAPDAGDGSGEGLQGDVEGVADAAAEHWLGNGGNATLRSWGIAADTPRRGWRERIPPAQLALLRGLALHHEAGGYLFVHAGIEPGLPLGAQSAHDLLWMREPFLSWTGTLGAVVVHGHTPARTPELRQHRIGVDTGAVTGGALTCVVLDERRLGFLHA